MSRLNGEAMDNFIRAQARYTLAKLDYDRMVAMAQTLNSDIVADYTTATEMVRAAAEQVLVPEVEHHFGPER